MYSSIFSSAYVFRNTIYYHVSGLSKVLLACTLEGLSMVCCCKCDPINRWVSMSPQFSIVT
jgi:hypothetical protein